MSHFGLRASTCKAGLLHWTCSSVTLNESTEIGLDRLVRWALIMVTDNLHGNACTVPVGEHDLVSRLFGFRQKHPVISDNCVHIMVHAPQRQ